MTDKITGLPVLPVEVTQADRDAAAPFAIGHGFIDGYSYSHGHMIRTGKFDDHSLVRAFARHRLTPRQDGLREALVDHNERLRSAVAIADREGADTNWLAFRGQCRFTLAEHQDVVNEARAAIGVRNGYAPGNYSIFCIDCKREAHDCDKGAIRCAECAAALSDISPLANDTGALREALDGLRCWRQAGEDWARRGGDLMQLDTFVDIALAELDTQPDRGEERPSADRLAWGIKGLEANIGDELLGDDIKIVLAAISPDDGEA